LPDQPRIAGARKSDRAVADLLGAFELDRVRLRRPLHAGHAHCALSVRLDRGNAGVEQTARLLVNNGARVLVQRLHRNRKRRAAELRIERLDFDIVGRDRS
jgi:hypothetical protein